MFSQITQLEWSHPWWGVLALQPLLMGALLMLRRRQVLHYAEPHLLPWAIQSGGWRRQDSLHALLQGVAWLLLALAAAGPRLPLDGQFAEQGVPRHEMDVMVVLDVSPSMLAQDVTPQRLQRAKLELLDLLPRLRGERVGLVAYSGSAGLLMPLNRDYEALKYFLAMTDTRLFEAPGTSLGSALERAQRELQEKRGSGSSAILLLTDAETSALSGPAGAAADEAVSKLKQAGIPLFILGISTPEGATIPQDNGFPLVENGVEVVSRLDSDGFAGLARRTGGKFAVVADGDSDWRTLYENGLLSLPGGKQAADNVQAWHELYAWFLLPALLLFAWRHGFLKFPQWRWSKLRWSRLGQVTLLVLAGSLFDVSPAEAGEEEAYAAWRNADYRLAQTLYAELPGYAARMGEGAAAYRRKDYNYAIRQFSQALLEAREVKQREQALFNLGNSYFMAQGYRAAADAYWGVLQYAPENRQAEANLALATGKLVKTGGAGSKSNGLLGRRGREMGGRMDMEPPEENLDIDKEKKSRDTLLRGEQAIKDAERAKLRTTSGQQSTAELPEARDAMYQAAQKKLELLDDKPAVLMRALIKQEAARDYVPQPEMSPW